MAIEQIHPGVIGRIDIGRTLFSQGLHDQTEKPGQFFPIDTHMVIRDRYDFAAEMAPGRRVLEVGCGAGMGLRYLAKHARCLHAAEYSDENFAALKDRFADIATIKQLDAHDMSYGDASFDLIVALAMIYYLSFEKFLKEAHRVLAPAGILFFCTSNKDVPGFCAAPYTTRYYTVPEMAAYLRKAGFDPEFYGAFPAPGGNLWKRRLRALVKNVAKAAIRSAPSGAGLWSRLRSASMGDTVPLPDRVEEMPISPFSRDLISEDRRNFNHRVIYVKARKREV